MTMQRPALRAPRRFAHPGATAAQVKHPCILQHFGAFLERVNGKRVAVFLDYDGKRLLHPADTAKPVLQPLGETFWWCCLL